MTRTLNRLGNAKQVAALKTVGWHGDGGGLFLRVLPNGARRWIVVDQTGGKRKERSVGTFPEVGLAEARTARAAGAEAFRDPGKVTFGEFADEFLKSVLPGFKNDKHIQQWENTLQTHGGPLRGILIATLTTSDVLAVLTPIWNEIPETAARLRGRIERILGAAKAKGLRPIDSINPAAWDGHLEHFLKRPRKRIKRRAAMAWQGMPAFVAELRKKHSTSARALEITILAWTRTSETVGARCGEVDLARRLWTIPGERMKAGVEHVIPLTDRMVAIFEVMMLGLRADERVFPLSSMAMLMLLKGMGHRNLTVHGFRSAARDWAGDATDHPREIAEMALAHAVGSAVEQAYRRGSALAKRGALMADWEAFLAG
jgi:integrase